MSEWKQKRFWTDVHVHKAAQGFAIYLDERAVKTPLKTSLILPTDALAQSVACEWRAQADVIDPLGMPYTRSANAALDKVTPQKTEVADLLAAYGESDLLCYRAEGPAALQTRQSAAWDPILTWAEEQLCAPMKVTQGMMHVTQPPASLKNLAVRVHALNPFALTAFYDLVSLTGSILLGFAVAHGRATAEKIWEISRIDEDWQIEHWGRDAEADSFAGEKKRAFLHAEAFLRASDIT